MNISRNCCGRWERRRPWRSGSSASIRRSCLRKSSPCLGEQALQITARLHFSGFIAGGFVVHVRELPKVALLPGDDQAPKKNAVVVREFRQSSGFRPSIGPAVIV